jgi:hypothetical protein
MQQEDVYVCERTSVWLIPLDQARGASATFQVEIPTGFKFKNILLQGDGAGRGSFCPCGGRGQGILTPVQAHEAFQESSLFILPILILF